MRSRLIPTLIITLIIVLVPLAPRIAVAGMDFVSIFEVNGVECWLNLNEIGSRLTPDANDEVTAGMVLASAFPNVLFRGIMRWDKAIDMGLLGCIIPR